MSEAQIPKHDALINNGALSSPSSGSSGGCQESVGLAASSKKVKTQSPVEWCLQQLSKTLHALFSPASLVPHMDWGLGPQHKGGICGNQRGTADCMALRLLLTREASTAGRWSTDVWIPLGP